MKLSTLIETPIGDYEMIGNWGKNSSFRSPRDRMILQNPRTIDLVKEKFNNCDYTFNFYFVNSPAADKWTEQGKVTMDWVKENLGEEVADAINMENDGVNIIFTNNKGAARMPMTGWIMAHRIGHALFRADNSNQTTNKYYMQAMNELVNFTSFILSTGYGVSGFPETGHNLMVSNIGQYDALRQHQLVARNFWEQIGTFKSARDGNLREYFEMLNELFAQYLTTSGGIKFNPLPMRIKGKHTYTLNTSDRIVVSECNTALDSMAAYISNAFDAAIGSSIGSIFVM